MPRIRGVQPRRGSALQGPFVGGSARSWSSGLPLSRLVTFDQRRDARTHVLVDGINGREPLTQDLTFHQP